MEKLIFELMNLKYINVLVFPKEAHQITSFNPNLIALHLHGHRLFTKCKIRLDILLQFYLIAYATNILLYLLEQVN